MNYQIQDPTQLTALRASIDAEQRRRALLNAQQQKLASVAATSIPAAPVVGRQPMQIQDPVQVRPPLTYAPWEGVSMDDLARAANGPDAETMERFRRQQPPAAPVIQRNPMQIQDPTQLPMPAPQLSAPQQSITRPPLPAVSDFAETNPPASPPPAVAPAARPLPQSIPSDAGGTPPRVIYPDATVDPGPSTKANLQSMSGGQERAMAQPETAPERNVPSADKLNQMSWDNQALRERAVQGAAQDPSFMDKARSWLDELGNYFNPAAGGGDPNALHPAYGVPNAQVWEAQRGTLFNAGILLMAAGLPNTSPGRAQIISQMGPALNQTADTVVRMSQARTAGYNRTPTDLKIYERYQSDPKFREYWDKYKMGQTDRFMQQERYKLWTDAKEGGYMEAQLAKDTMTFTKQMYDLVQNGIFTGSLAEQRRNAANFLTTFLPGLTDEQVAQAVANDYNFRGLVMEQVLPRMQELGGNDSEQELAELKRMIADPSAPRRAIEMKLQQVMEKQIMRYNRLKTIGDMSTPEGDPYRLPELNVQPLAPAQPYNPPAGGTGAPPPARPRILSVE